MLFRSPGAEAEGDVPRPGEVLVADGDIELNAGRARVSLTVLNTGDRPVQVASHYHFFEANKALDFDREAAFGMRLDVMAGAAVRFEPGESKAVTLVAIGGDGDLSGLNDLTRGDISDEAVKRTALERARGAGYRGA